MLRVEPNPLDEGGFTTVSDDQQAENGLLQEAIDLVAPSHSEDFADTEVGEDGMLRYDWPRITLRDLLDVTEYCEAQIGFISGHEAVAEAVRAMDD